METRLTSFSVHFFHFFISVAAEIESNFIVFRNFRLFFFTVGLKKEWSNNTVNECDDCFVSYDSYAHSCVSLFLVGKFIWSTTSRAKQTWIAIFRLIFLFNTHNTTHKHNVRARYTVWFLYKTSSFSIFHLSLTLCLCLCLACSLSIALAQMFNNTKIKREKKCSSIVASRVKLKLFNNTI